MGLSKFTFDNRQSRRTLGLCLAAATALSFGLLLTQASIAGSGVGNFILAGVLMFISLCLGSSSYGLLYLNRKLSRALAPSLWRHFVSISLVFALMQVAVAGNVMDIMIGTSLFSAMLFFLAFPVQSSNS